MLKKLQKHWKFLFGIIIIAVFFLGYIYKDSTMQAHDLSFHLANIKNLLENHFKPSFIMPKLANNLGYGLYIFYPFLPHFVYALGVKLLSVFSISIVQGILTMNVFISILSAILMYVLSFRIFKNKKIAFVSALIYLLFPYRLGTITVRMALNENFCSLFLPLILLGLTYLFGQTFSKRKFLLFFILGYVGLIFSHFIIAIYFSLILFIILLFYIDRFRQKAVLISFFEGVVIVSIFVLPNILLFLEHYGMDYLVYQENYITSFGLIQDNLLSLKDFVIPTSNYDWTIPYYLYLPVIVGFFYSLFLAWKTSNSFCMLLTVLSVFLIFVMTFSPLWRILPSIFYNIQFPWRLLLILTVFLSLLVPTCLKKCPSSWFYGIVVFSLLFSLPLIYKLSIRIYHLDYSTVEIDAGLGNLKEYYPSEYLEYLDYYKSKTKIDFLYGGADILVIEDDPHNNKLVFSVENSNQSVLEFPKIYYKGYKLVNQNGESISLDKSKYGFVCASLIDGTYTLTYSGTLLFRIFSAIRIYFVIITIGIYFIQFIMNKKHKYSHLFPICKVFCK